MANNKQAQDPGVGTQYTLNSKRIINKDGSFNVTRSGLKASTRNTYQTLISISWGPFLLIIFLFLMAINALFALIYTFIGVEQIAVHVPLSLGSQFLSAYFFSFQTFTTVGYGVLHPIGYLTSIIASLESVAGWMCFALITGILYGRFSKPSARLMYSEKAIISPYKEGINSLKFRIANMRNSNLMELDATVLLMKVERTEDRKGVLKRNFVNLELERKNILFFPLNWTIVHPIDEKSPFYNKSKEEMLAMDAEVLIMIKGFDDTFSQIVHSRYSYKCEEIIWGAQYSPAYNTEESGEIILDFSKMSDYQKVEL